MEFCYSTNGAYLWAFCRMAQVLKEIKYELAVHKEKYDKYYQIEWMFCKILSQALKHIEDNYDDPETIKNVTIRLFNAARTINNQNSSVPQNDPVKWEPAHEYQQLACVFLNNLHEHEQPTGVFETLCTSLHNILAKFDPDERSQLYEILRARVLKSDPEVLKSKPPPLERQPTGLPPAEALLSAHHRITTHRFHKNSQAHLDKLTPKGNLTITTEFRVALEDSSGDEDDETSKDTTSMSKGNKDTSHIERHVKEGNTEDTEIECLLRLGPDSLVYEFKDNDAEHGENKYVSSWGTVTVRVKTDFSCQGSGDWFHSSGPWIVRPVVKNLYLPTNNRQTYKCVYSVNGCQVQMCDMV